MAENEIAALTRMAANAKSVRLFLDYDGTLAEFAPSPDFVLPDEKVISLVEQLVSAQGILPAVISGRRLAHIQKLLPVTELLLAGTYGIEMLLPDGRYRSAFPYEQARPRIEQLIPRWSALIKKKEGFYLEDKGWSLALHGRYAQEEELEEVMAAAYKDVQALPKDVRFRLLVDDRFLEYAPIAASKKISVKWVLKEMTPKEALVVYIGDDDKDEEAFGVVMETGGFAVRVGAEITETHAQFRLMDPSQVQAWLRDLITARRN